MGWKRLVSHEQKGSVQYPSLIYDLPTVFHFSFLIVRPLARLPPEGWIYRLGQEYVASIVALPEPVSAVVYRIQRPLQRRDCIPNKMSRPPSY